MSDVAKAKQKEAASDVLNIIQGTNEPIRIDFEDDVSDSIDMHVGIFTNKDETLMHWNYDEITVSGSSVYCPLTQDQTMSMPVGSFHMEIKRTDASGNLIPYDKIPVTVEHRSDRHPLNETVVSGE